MKNKVSSKFVLSCFGIRKIIISEVCFNLVLSVRACATVKVGLGGSFGKIVTLYVGEFLILTGSKLFLPGCVASHQILCCSQAGGASRLRSVKVANASWHRKNASNCVFRCVHQADGDVGNSATEVSSGNLPLKNGKNQFLKAAGRARTSLNWSVAAEPLLQCVPRRSLGTRRLANRSRLSGLKLQCVPKRSLGTR